MQAIYENMVRFFFKKKKCSSISPGLGAYSGLLMGPGGDGGAGATVGENSLFEFVPAVAAAAAAFLLALFSLEEKQGKQFIILLFFPSYYQSPNKSSNSLQYKNLNSFSSQ